MNNHKLQDSNLRTYAVIEAQSIHGLTDATDYLLPFIQASISKFDGSVLDYEAICQDLEKSFKLDIPIYLIKTLDVKLVSLGALSYDETIRGYICKDSVSSSVKKFPVDIFSGLDASIARFSERHNVAGPFYSPNWQDAVLLFFSGAQGSAKTKVIEGKVVGNLKEKDDLVVSKYIIDCESSSKSEFETMKKIYAAYSLVDTLLTIQNPGKVRDWKKFAVIYDATVLMRLLGTSGRLLQKATMQIHENLKQAGCKSFYFEHNLQEAVDNISAIIQGLQHNGRIHHETAKAVEDGELTLAYIKALSANLEVSLGELGIVQVEMPNRMDNRIGQISPAELETALRASINYQGNQKAAVIDAHSIENVLFLRRGRKHRNIEECEYIFVTHNNTYARVVTNFCRSSCAYLAMHIPPIVTLNSLSRLAWLASANSANTYDVTAELIVNCYQAASPDSKWINSFWETIRTADPRLLDTDYKESLYLLSLRRDLETETLGNIALLENIGSQTILRRIKEYKEKEDQLREEEKRQHLSELSNVRLEAMENQRLVRTVSEAEKQEEINELNQKHQRELEKRARSAVAETERKANSRIEKSARRLANVATRGLSLTVGLIFGGLYLIYGGVPSENLAGLTLRGFFIVLTLLQIVGLFVKNVGFFFFAPRLESYLFNLLRKTLLSDQEAER